MMPILELYTIGSTWDACCSVIIANKVALNIPVHVSGCTWAGVTLGHMLLSGLLGHRKAHATLVR